MGCASSQPLNDSAPIKVGAPTPAPGAAPSPEKQKEVVSPLFSAPGPQQPTITQNNGESQPSPRAVPSDKPAASLAQTQSSGRRGQSEGVADTTPRTRRESDEESNWDQCSTSNYDLDQQPGTCPPVATDLDAGTDSPSQPSVAARAHTNSLQAEQPPAPQPEQVEYRETTIMRVEKFKGCMFVNQYLVVKFLGRGACGKVFLCLNTMDLRLYAMKAVRKVDIEATQAPLPPGSKPRRNPMDDLKREILIMKKMKHNNVVMLSEVIDDPAGSKLLLVMEFMEGGPVLTREALEKREKLPEMLALQYFRDMVKSLDYLHCNKVVHGDLKPENVLMSATGEVKLSDFGCSKIFATGNEYLERCNGTPAFLAPEMMKPNTRFKGRPTDIYALGACLYTLIYGRIPFSAPNLYKLFQVVQNEPVRYPEDVPVTDALKHLLGAMLGKNPRDRISLSEIMRHPWVTMSGQFPLKSTRDLQGDETQERHGGLLHGRSFAEAHPCPDYLTGLALISHHDRSFREGDVIMRQGDPGGFLLYIVSGTVDVLVNWQRPTTGRGPASGNRPGGPGTQGQTDEFPEDNETLSPVVDEESYAHRMTLANAAAKACDFVNSLQNAAGTVNQLLVAQRGPGELVGEMAVFSKTQTRSATVRCNTAITGRVVSAEQLMAYLIEQPMAKHQIREGIWKKESEITIVDALVKLANSSAIINTSLQNVNSQVIEGAVAAGQTPFMSNGNGNATQHGVVAGEGI